MNTINEKSLSNNSKEVFANKYLLSLSAMPCAEFEIANESRFLKSSSLSQLAQL